MLIMSFHNTCVVALILFYFSYCIEHKTQALKVTNETLQTATSVSASVQ